METHISYLPPKYTEKFLPPIIQDSTQENKLNEIQKSTSYLLPAFQPNTQTTISEYISSSQPNPFQSATISEYKSTPQPNSLQPPTISENKPIIQSNILQPTTISEYKSTSYPNVLHPSTILENKSTPMPNPIQLTSISEYKSTSYPNQNPNILQSKIKLEKKSISYPIPLPSTTISEYNSTSYPNAQQPTKILENKSNSYQNPPQTPIGSQHISSPPPNFSQNSPSVEIKPIITKPINNPQNLNGINIQNSMASNRSFVSQSIVSHPLDTQIPMGKSTITQPLIQQSHISNQSNIQININANNNNNIQQSAMTSFNNKSLMGQIPGALPVYRLIRQGAGINPTEQQGIVFCAMKVFQEEIFPLSNNTAKFIQRKIGGDWLVIVYEEGKPIDFNMTCVEGVDYMYFTLDNIAYQVCRLR